MELEEYIGFFAELFEETERSEFKPKTRFRDLEEWSSLMALSVIAMADTKYKIKITGEEIRKSVTIEDIFKIVKSKQI
jgi:acyl carrier protein